MSLDPEYIRQRLVDPDMKVRDVGLAIAATVPSVDAAGQEIVLPFDSESFRELMGRRLLEELRRAGYAVTFDPAEARG